MKHLINASFILILSNALNAQDWVQISQSKVVLDNGSIAREISVGNDSIIGTSVTIRSSEGSFIAKSHEFSFLANNQLITGYSGWKVIGVEKIEGENDGEGVSLRLASKTLHGLEVNLNYLLYPNLPLVRKWIDLKNTGMEPLKIENLNVEDLQGNLDFVHSVVLHNYARMKHLGRFVGDWDDPVVVVHDIRKRKGLALGNEAMGVLKRTAYHTEGHRNNLEIGMTHTNQDFPFRKWVAPGGSFETPKTFICPYADRDDGYEVINEEVNRFIILHMKPRIIQLEEKPIFVYNTWYPFRTFVSDTLMREVAEAAADCGLQEMIIDDGWQINYKGKTSEQSWGGNYGDWLVDENKFRGGLKPTFDYIKSRNMKPGLWISICSATPDSRVFREHPEWFVEDSIGNPGNVHYSPADGKFFSPSFGTEWKEYIKDRILDLYHEYGLRYAKLDFAVVTSAYINDDRVSGSYATGHPYYKDHEESFYVIYDRVLELFDDLHQEAPDLFIDCTFETAGKLQLMDYAIAQHAEGNWLSNFEEPSPVGPLRVRQMAWWRSPALPASSLVIGNLPMDDPDFEFGLKSLIGTLPIVLGDPRKLSLQKRANIRAWSDWMQEMQRKYDYMGYRRDLPGFGEPKEGSWDGWQRINFQTKEGGIFGVFRQGALEGSRRVFLKDLTPEAEYQIRLAPEGKIIWKASGTTLMEEGFDVEIIETYDGNIYEVRQL
jgi:alpha-galactosidase